MNDTTDAATLAHARHPIPDARGINLYLADPDAAALFAHYLPAPLFAHLAPRFVELGALAGARLDELADTADHHPPTLSVRTRAGIDESRVLKHPAYVEMERLAFGEYGLAALSHRGGVLGWPEPMPAPAKYALTYLFVQAEFGLCCPVSMTDSLTRTLRRFGTPALSARYLPRLLSQDLDTLTQGAMFMTEQAAGSDVAGTETVAIEQADGSFALSGDKWFCSNPDAGLAMVLARSEGLDATGPAGAGGTQHGAGPDAPKGLRGLSLFLLPRERADGTPNRYRILRLKDKLGTRSMASGEIRLEGAQAWLVGERGKGFRHMADMVNNSRLSNGVRAAGLMRRALTEATFVAHERRAFGRALADMPLMQRQLRKMTLATEQARTMVFQTARALQSSDAAGSAGPAYALARIMTPLIKFRACRDARKVTGDAMEVRGGCGYIEEWSDARRVRDAHLGSIWEGTSNIVALDVIRAIRREGSLPALQALVSTLLEDGARCPGPLASLQAERIDAAWALAQRAADGADDGIARQAATALYHVVTLAGLRHEARVAGLAHRNALADDVLRHRLAARDPLAGD